MVSLATRIAVAFRVVFCVACRVAFCAAFWIIAVGMVIAPPARADISGKMEAPARQLVDGILQSISLTDKAYAYVYGTRPVLAVWPFDTNKVPVAKDLADEMNNALMAQIINIADGRLEVKARESISTLIENMEASGALARSGQNPVSSMMKSAQEIDILIEGIIRPVGRSIQVTYKALRIDSSVVKIADPVRIDLRVEETQANRRALALDQAIEAAATQLANQAHDMKHMILGGIRYQDQGVQTPFGSYFMERISAAVEARASNILTGKKLAVQPMRIGSIGTRGMDVAGVDLRDSAMAPSSDSYVLNGTYWEFDDALEVKLSLRNAENKSVSWVGKVRLDSIGRFDYRPKRRQSHGGFARLRENDSRGPIAFSMTTDHGKDPAYKIGETMNLLLKLDRSAWLYCFYYQANGETIQFFPNPHFWRKFREPRLAGGVAHTIPGKNTFPFHLRMSPPAGEELLKCFATGRDVTAELPEALQGRSLDPLPAGLDMRLPQVFRSIAGAEVSEASQTVTVAEK